MSATAPVSIAVLASGRGTNFEAIHQAIAKGKLDARIVGLVSDRPDAEVLARARALGVETRVITGLKGLKGMKLERKEHDRLVLEALRGWSPGFLVMAGYMRIVTRELIDAFRSERGYSRIVNVHPSLLPAFPGVDAYRQAFRYGATVTGVTVHLVDEGLDSGPICAQEAFSIADCPSPEAVERRGLEVEHRLYPESLRWILPEKFEIHSHSNPDNRRLCVRPN